MSNSSHDASRRKFLQTVGAGAAVASAGLIPSVAAAAKAATTSPESLVETLYKSLNESQRKTICYDWNYTEEERGLLRTRAANNWHITKPRVNHDFYTADQQEMIRAIFLGLIAPEWHKKYDQQLQDDCDGWGDQSIAKVSVVGVGMRSHAGVATRMFDALAAENINILMISTSEIKISVVVAERYLELAVRCIHSEFNLGDEAVTEESAS